MHFDENYFHPWLITKFFDMFTIISQSKKSVCLWIDITNLWDAKSFIEIRIESYYIKLFI